MVLIRILPLLALVGCKQSLFDAKTGGDTDAGTTVPQTCPAPCIADGGADFLGARPWRYLEDHRNRSWTPMTPAGGGVAGADPANAITSCANAGASACDKLPGALVVSSSSHAAAADPAVELTIAQNQVVTIALGAFFTAGADQTIRLYRNSREDVLFTGVASAGALLSASITLDVLQGDRILVAVAPTTAGVKDLALQLFVSDAGTSFPSDCLLALSFAPTTGTIVHDSCRAPDLASKHYDPAAMDSVDQPIKDTTAPFPELGRAALLAQNDFYSGVDPLDRTGDTTTQLWLRQATLVQDTAGWFFSDLDLTNAGGLGIDVGTDGFGGPAIIEAYTCTSTTATAPLEGVTTSFPDDHLWHFVRVVYTNGTMTLCLDGKKRISKPFGSLKTQFPPYIGKDVVWSPPEAYVDGAVDDVRVLKGALPCDD